MDTAVVVVAVLYVLQLLLKGPCFRILTEDYHHHHHHRHYHHDNDDCYHHNHHHQDIKTNSESV